MIFQIFNFHLKYVFIPINVSEKMNSQSIRNELMNGNLKMQFNTVVDLFNDLQASSSLNVCKFCLAINFQINFSLINSRLVVS